MASGLSLPCHYTKKRYFLLSWGRKRQHRLGQGHLKSQRAEPGEGAFPTLPVGLTGAHGSCEDGGHKLVHTRPPAAVEAGHVHAAREHQCGSCLGLPPDPLAAPLVAFPCETQVGPGPHGRVSHRELVLFGFNTVQNQANLVRVYSTQPGPVLCEAPV